MSILDEIYETYSLIDGWLSSAEYQDAISGETPRTRRAELNNYAYFVLLFGQLEDFIDRQFEQLVGPPEQTAFRHRVNCLFAISSRTVDKLLDYYSLRCDIAHGYAAGGRMGERIHLPQVYENISRIMSENA